MPLNRSKPRGSRPLRGEQKCEASMPKKGMRAVSERRQKKKKKENLNNRLALIGITLVVLSLAVTVQVKGNELRRAEKQLIIQEENLEAQVKAEEERAARLEEQRVYVQTKEYIEKVAKEKLGLVNRGEVILKPSEKQ